MEADSKLRIIVILDVYIFMFVHALRCSSKISLIAKISTFFINSRFLDILAVWIFNP